MTPAWANDDAVQAMVRAKLADGSLPTEAPRRTWGGPGTGRLCAACNQKTGRSEMEIETEDAEGRQRFYHVDCFKILTREQRQTGTSGAPDRS